MKKYIVYMHIFPNNKKYIGITSKTPNGRWEGGSGYDSIKQPVMYNAIQKYGWDNIQHIILFENLSYKEACQKEVELIKLYKTNCRKYGNDYGYNMTDGGDGTTGHVVSDETKQKMSKIKQGRVGKDCPNSRSVYCDGKIYDSLTQFREENNVTKNVSKWLDGRVGMPKKWYDKDLHYIGQDKSVIWCSKTEWSKKIKYDGIVFKSQVELANYLGITPSTLCQKIKRGTIDIERINT